MELLEQIKKEIEMLEHERNIEIYSTWVNTENKEEAYKISDKINKKYKNKLYNLDVLKIRLESVIDDFEYYKNNK